MPMNELGPWSTDDFELMSWHDVHVYGFRLDNFKPDDGSSDLILDIDYILKWNETENHFIFTVCRAELRFHDIFGLKINIDYTMPPAGMSPFMIAEIEREHLEFSTGYTSYQWKILINWPSGYLDFQSPNFSQKLIGKPNEQTGQMLSEEDRDNKNVI
jgi:hypothetical protein